MKLPIDTSAMQFVCAVAAEPLVDFETKQPRADDSGDPLYSLQLLALADGEANIIGVKVAGKLADTLRPGIAVKVNGLTAQPWTMGDRSGISYRADRIEPATGATKAS